MNHVPSVSVFTRSVLDCSCLAEWNQWDGHIDSCHTQQSKLVFEMIFHALGTHS